MLDFYEKGYYYEFERKGAISEGVSLPVSIVVAVSGALYYIISQYIIEYDEFNFLDFIFILLSTASIVLIFLCVFFLIRAFWSAEYAHLDDYDALKKYESDLLSYYLKKQNEVDARKLSKQDFLEYLERLYSKTSTINYNINLKRSFFLHRGKVFLFCCIPIVFCCAAVLLARGFERNLAIHAAEVLSHRNTEIAMSDDDEKEKDSGNENTSEKPSEPPIKFIKEDRKRPD
tara:strand:+ start:837 stop:1529 length:693 start_codon:yes stop_codon:yes gene_type:complete